MKLSQLISRMDQKKIYFAVEQVRHDRIKAWRNEQRQEKRRNELTEMGFSAPVNPIKGAR